MHHFTFNNTLVVLFLFLIYKAAITTTAIRTKHIDELHLDHQLWNNETRFYADELKIFQKKLEKMSLVNSGIDFRKQIEHFQDQFIIQKEQLEILNNEIKLHEGWLAEYAGEHGETIEHDLFADHLMMRGCMETFRKIYDDLKSDFYDFLEKWR